MAKEYFSHDYNARHDRKIAALVGEYKSSGYGVFWALCEMIHEERGSLELDDITVAAVAKDLNEDFGFVKKCIGDCISKFKLFLKNDDNLESGRAHRNLHKRQTISEIRSNSGKAGAFAKQMQANAEQKEAKEIKVKERKLKEKEIKEKESSIVESFPINQNIKKKTEDMIVIEMVKIFKEKKKAYLVNPDVDYPACLEIAYHIAKLKGWKKIDVVGDKETDILLSWKKIVDFIVLDKWFTTRTLPDIAGKEWNRIEPSMKILKNGTHKKDIGGGYDTGVKDQSIYDKMK